jgi:hypothetical protein
MIDELERLQLEIEERTRVSREIITYLRGMQQRVDILTQKNGHLSAENSAMRAILTREFSNWKAKVYQ